MLQKRLKRIKINTHEQKEIINFWLEAIFLDKVQWAEFILYDDKVFLII